MNMNDNYLFFWDGECSQWYPSNFEEFGERFNCAEQFMMAAKSKVFVDNKAYNDIMASNDPYEQKTIGRTVHGFNAETWDKVSRDYVTLANYNKFTQDHALAMYLTENADRYFVEASPYDRIWGIGHRENDPLVHDKDNWRGTNWLGECINRARDIIVENRIEEIETLRKQLNWNK